METSLAKKVKVGLFITAGLIIFAVAVFVIGSKTNMFTPTFKVNAVFTNAVGLKEGAFVRLNGINVGTVNNIYIESTDKVIAELVIEESVKRFVKKDSKVKITTEGMIGNKVVEITEGSPNSPHVNNDDYIETLKPIEVQDILNSLYQTSSRTDSMVIGINRTITTVNSGQGTLGKLLYDETLYRDADSILIQFNGSSKKINVAIQNVMASVNKITDNAGVFTTSLNNVTDNLDVITTQIKEGKGMAGKLLTDTTVARHLDELVANANNVAKNLEQGSYSFAENMEALKHNFFFKGYFEDRGYWDKDKTETVIDQKKKQLEDLEQKIRVKQKQLEELNKSSGESK